MERLLTSFIEYRTTMLYNIGIHYRLLGSSASSTSTRTDVTMVSNEISAKSKHWAVVFTPKDGARSSVRVELDCLDNGNIDILNKSYPEMALPSHPLATYEGSLSDIDEVLKILPIRSGDKYSTWFNNCQHFAATFLVFLDAFAENRKNRSFHITEVSRMSGVLSVLNKNGSTLSNRVNIYMVSPAPVAGIATVGALAAAEATVISTVPATGLLGWLGATTTVVAPAAYASLAAAAVPITAVTAVGAGVALAWNYDTWKGKTKFDDPRVSGFPSQWSANHDRMM